jgi:ABC-type multidrug transport system fused ATPase/permease subunit
LIWQTSKIISDILLAIWTKFQDLSSNYEYFWIYLALAGFSTFFIYFRVLILSIGSYKCSDELHKTMITNLIKAPINLYHDTIPRGQILNNLSKDLSTIDGSIMYNYGTVLEGFIGLLGGIVVCSIFMPYSLFLLPFLTYLCYAIIRVYINGARDLFRLEGIAKSRILNTLSETISGITTIRAHKNEKQFLENFFRRAENLMKVKLFSLGASNWLSLILNNLCNLYFACLIIFTIIFKDTLEAQSVSLLLGYSMYIQAIIFFLFLELVNFELGMISMERCLKYENIAQEASSDCLLDDQLTDWPQRGK